MENNHTNPAFNSGANPGDYAPSDNDGYDGYEAFDVSSMDACDAFMAGGSSHLFAMYKSIHKLPPPPGDPQPEPPRIPRITFRDPCGLRDYKCDPKNKLVGNEHIMRGEMAVIGGEPGVGKSRAATALAVAGATGGRWFGLEVHRQFKTMIIQTENGPSRLQREYSAFDCDALQNWIRVSDPPPFGLTLNHPEFIADIKAALDEFKPDVVVLDPWNAAAKDDKQKDYVATFDALRVLLPIGPDKPALVIVAHTRKPAPGEKRKGGTDLLHILSGSHVLSSYPRSVFIMTRANDQETSDLVVWFNPKNNNGKQVNGTAWHRTGSGFIPAADFDWVEFENGGEEPETRGVTLEHLKQVFAEGTPLQLSEAVHRLSCIAGITENSGYNALGKQGKFAAHFQREGKIITFTLQPVFHSFIGH